MKTCERCGESEGSYGEDWKGLMCFSCYANDVLEFVGNVGGGGVTMQSLARAYDERVLEHENQSSSKEEKEKE